MPYSPRPRLVRSRTTLITALMTVAGLSAVAASPAAAGGGAMIVQPQLATVAAQHPHRRISVIVQFRAGVSESRSVALVRSFGGHVDAKLPIIRAVAADLPAREAVALGRRRAVRAISINARVKGTEYSSNPLANLATTYPWTTGAPSAWISGSTGAGVGVAVVDSGVDGHLADFSTYAGQGGSVAPGTPPSSRVVESAVVNPGATDAGDPLGHGTMVAGIIAGNSLNRPSDDPNSGRYIGIAPNANLVSIKVGDDSANATVLDAINGIQFAIQHQADANIRVINLSVASSVPQSYLTDPLDAAVESAWQHGIVVVAAAGNLGNAPGAVDYAPANDPYVITVGAVDEQGTSSLSDDQPASYSSTGTTQDGFAKPELYAPGSHIVSALAPGSAFSTLCPACVVGGAYIRASGTSFAAPVVSGAVADLLQRDPGLTPAQVKGALLASAATVSGSWGSLSELRIGRAMSQAGSAAPADQGLTHSTLLGDGASLGDWSDSAFVPATGGLAAGYARSSWSCSDCTGSPGGGLDSTRSRWSRSSWSVASGN